MCKSYICSLNLYVFLNVFAVEAYVASWIEMFLWNIENIEYGVEAYVASWIEILVLWVFESVFVVEAYVASWIEIEIVHDSYRL